MIRKGTVGLVVVACVLVVSACSAPTSSSNPREDVTGSGAPVNQLPDGVPLVRQAQLAADPRTTADGAVTGWSAVAVMPTSISQSEATNDVMTTLRSSGWTVSTRTVNGAQLVTGRRPNGLNGEWLNVTITVPVPSGGPALAYRYVRGPQPVVPS